MSGPALEFAVSIAVMSPASVQATGIVAPNAGLALPNEAKRKAAIAVEQPRRRKVTE